jgi:protein involved in polysaccharide export with SLBB domain
MMYLIRSAALLAFLIGAALSSAPAAAQDALPDWRSAELSRADLNALLAQHASNAASGTLAADTREQANREVDLIRYRLEEGDFRVGDQINLTVEGEENLTGMFLVQDGPALVLPVVGSIDLKGVLRSELSEHVQSELARFIRDPTVSAKSSIRLLVSGAVARSGYYVVPINTVFSEVLMLAGGPRPEADLRNISVDRADEVIWSGERLQQAIIEGRTLDQLSIHAGDHVVVPEERESMTAWEIFRTGVTTVGPVLMLAVTLMQVF